MLVLFLRKASQNRFSPPISLPSLKVFEALLKLFLKRKKCHQNKSTLKIIENPEQQNGTVRFHLCKRLVSAPPPPI